MKILRIFMAIIMIGSTGCSFSQEKVDSEDMYIKAAALRKLSASVESAVQYKNAPPALKDAELLTFATKHDPGLLDGFGPYVLKARSSNKHSAVLMCDAGGQKALIEDTGCTGRLDVHHWKNPVLQPCEFTIKIEDLCS